MDNTLAHRLQWTIWPAFLVAAVAETIFFTVFDPTDLYFFGSPLELSRQAMYTLGFFGFWGMGVASSALTVFLARSSYEINRCPMTGFERPPGCPKRETDSDPTV